MWKVKYLLGGVEYEAMISDDSSGNRFTYDEEEFAEYVEDEHGDDSIDDVEVLSAIQADHPLADFF